MVPNDSNLTSINGCNERHVSEGPKKSLRTPFSLNAP